MPRRVFVTVGTTSFDELIAATTTPQFAQTLAALGFGALRLQVGRGAAPPDGFDWFRFSPTIADEMRQAGVVISHAGAGSILEALELGKKLVVCANDALMDNHQLELAAALEARGHVVVARGVGDLGAALGRVVEARIVPYAPGDADPFRALVDGEMRTSRCSIC